MGDEMLNEIYQELYAIRAEMQSMNIRSSLESMRGTLDQIRAEIIKLNRSLGGPSAGGPSAGGSGEGVEEPSKKRFGFF